MARWFDTLADATEADFQRLLCLLAWLLEHPHSGYALRQLPVLGLDTKWIEKKRRALVCELLQAVRGDDSAGDFYDVCGLRRPPQRLRLRILCPRLRAIVGGVCDLEAPLEELATLAIAPTSVLVIENLETGLALPDLPGCVAFMRLGNAVSLLASIGWLSPARLVYWGDLDTHGLAILDRARAALGDVRSVLMDEATLLAHTSLWGEEPTQCSELALTHLTPGERAVFDGLRSNRWGQQVRLEQERIPWHVALPVVRDACTS